MIRNISDTARWVAYYRAVESDRPDALFRDPFARRLAGPEGEAIARATRRGAAMAWAMAARTAAFDDMLLDCLRRGATRVINLAAGLDARPWRLPLPPDTCWVDVDLPGILDYKLETLHDAAPVCRYEALRADLTDPAERQRAFARLAADPAPAVALTEGLLIYLTREDAAALARAVHGLPRVRWWLIDIASPLLLRIMERSWGEAVRRADAPFRFAPPEGTKFYEPFGWRDVEFRTAADESARRGRKMPFAWLYRVMALFMSKEKLNAYRTMSGFVRLERI